MTRKQAARLRRYLIVLAGAVAALWFAGLLLFVWNIADFAELSFDALGETDGIVVLTGGSERLGAGLQLLEAGKGKKLFISGVHPGLTLEHLTAGQNVPKELRACCIILGHEAASTMGNAEETLTWMTLEDYHSLRLVTSNYHMPRSLLIFRAAMPGIGITPYPVTPDSVKLHSWWKRPGTASLLVTEYDKYLFAALRLWFANP